MADWILVACLAKLRDEFNTIAPFRSKASDGTIGDPAHATRVSDHNPDETGTVPVRDADRVNEVHAIDVDVDLAVPGLSMEDVVQLLLSRCRSGAEQRLRYIIYGRRIWEADNDWGQRVYLGPNPHDKHAHFSASYVSALEASKAPWHLADLLQEEPMTNPTPAQIAAHDIDPSAATQSWGGAAFTTLVRTGYLANTFAPAISALINELNARVEDQEDSLDAAGASLALNTALLGQLTADPAEAGEAHPLVQAFRYVQAHPAPPAS